MGKILYFPLHTLLFGVFPVLALIAVNLQESPLEDGARALVISFLITAVLLGIFRLVTKDWLRAGLICTILLISFFSYGQFYMGLKSLGGVGIEIARHRFLLVLWLALTLFCVWYSWIRLPTKKIPNSTLNGVAAFLMILPLFQISSFVIRDWLASGATSTSSVISGVTTPTEKSESPDIYYIIADAYSRQDLLEDFFGFDNSGFLKQLKELGFYVADCSMSNYPWTRLSLTSSLNMDYLENLGITVHDQDDAAWRRIRNSEVRKKLTAQGYKIISLETGFYWTEWPDADLYFSQKDTGLHLTGFEALLLQTTLLRAPIDLLSDAEGGEPTVIQGGTLEERYNITKYALDILSELPDIEGPKFIFAHLLIPHDPFVFDAEGNFITETRDMVEAYDAQVTYLNQRLIPALKLIISQSNRPVVIILQGDHGGPHTQPTYDRLKILNAYYLPEAENKLYSSITPVNSFRIVFDTYFGTNLGLLEDLSYHSTTKSFSDVTLATDDNPACVK